jgi:uncharacterized protein (DUF302 family)
MDKLKYGFGTIVNLPFEAAVARTRDALAAQGFGILTEIDVRATLKKKLDVDFPPYVILGACNPPLAYQALSAEREIGLLLPCNVVVYHLDEGRSSVLVMDPEAAMTMSGNPAIAGVAQEARTLLAKALADVAVSPQETTTKGASYENQ